MANIAETTNSEHAAQRERPASPKGAAAFAEKRPADFAQNVHRH
ncbi:MAG: hypothetical protein U0990_02160 [Candidatus Nanopelagicales bacterium]|nr:hypothetical protein [Candidatus Nanopelagicales bacterium]MDZ7578240.1 hypothetical protein [Candidatus Nanopelagicales bacterium]